MKRLSSLFVFCVILVVIAAGCGTPKANASFNSKNKPLPDYVLNSSAKVKETYIMASNYSNVLSQVPCFCGCAADGHKNNLNCFIDQMGPNNTVEAWDNHGVT
jgi:hypothetical protein